MLRAILASFVYLLLLSSCRKPLAQFQKSTVENFDIDNYKSTKKPKLEKLTLEENTEIKTGDSQYELIMIANIDPIVSISKVKNKSSNIQLNETKNIKKLFVSLETSTLVKLNSSDLDKKKKKKNLFFNDNIKIGAIFLGIAIVLTFFGLTQLILIFGIASLVFIYLGLKKYYRRKRIRNFFNRKK